MKTEFCPKETQRDSIKKESNWSLDRESEEPQTPQHLCYLGQAL